MTQVKKHPWLYLLCILLIPIVCLVFFIVHNKLSIHGNSQELEDNLTYYILGIFTSLLLIVIGYIKFDEANFHSKLNYLLRIDERWASSEIIQAREVIHKLYLDAKKISPSSPQEWKIIVGAGIKYLHENKEKIEDFIRLLNFLDFLETIGYLHYINAVTVGEVRELLGNSIVYYYEIFRPFILLRRKETDDKKFYEHFESLYFNVINYKEPKCWLCNFKKLK